jgi:hypothetical protein
MVRPEIVQIVFSAKYRCNEVRIFILAKRNDKKILMFALELHYYKTNLLMALA